MIGGYSRLECSEVGSCFHMNGQGSECSTVSLFGAACGVSLPQALGYAIVLWKGKVENFSYRG